MKNAVKYMVPALVILLLAACIEDDIKDPADDPIIGPSDGPAWAKVANSTFGAGMVKSVAWGGGRFVAAGDNGRIAYSADGITWTQVANSTFGNNTVNCVAWGNNQFMAGGDNGRMAYSADGVSWTQVANSGFNALAVNGLARGSDKWVAVGRSTVAYSNADGTTWTSKAANDFFQFPQGPPTLNAVAFNGTRYVLAGEMGGQGHGGSMAYSADGINWTAHDIDDLTGSAVNGIACGGGKWAAVTASAILYSSNGTSWDSTENEIGTQFFGVAWGAGKFVAAGGNDAIQYSADGINWTAFTDVSLDSHFLGVAYGDGAWVAAGVSGAIAYYIEE